MLNLDTIVPSLDAAFLQLVNQKGEKLLSPDGSPAGFVIKSASCPDMAKHALAYYIDLSEIDQSQKDDSGNLLNDTSDGKADYYLSLINLKTRFAALCVVDSVGITSTKYDFKNQDDCFKFFTVGGFAHMAGIIFDFAHNPINFTEGQETPPKKSTKKSL